MPALQMTFSTDCVLRLVILPPRFAHVLYLNASSLARTCFLPDNHLSYHGANTQLLGLQREPISTDTVPRLLILTFNRHVFHLICIDPWVVQNRTCPLCKMDVVAYAVVNGLEPPPRPRSADTRPAPPLQDRTLSAADMLTQMRRYSTGGGHWDAEESSDPPPPPYEGVTPSAPAVSTANHRGAATADTRVSAASGKPDAETRRSASPPIYRRYAGTGQRELAQQPAQASTLRHPRPASTASSSASGRTVYLSFDESDGSTT